MFRTLNQQVMVAPQIAVDDVAEAARQGVTLIINNRPDGEEPSAPQGAEIEAAARAVGLDYVAIPVTHSGFSHPQVTAMADALDGAEKVLAYCRSGTRSTLLWSLARATKGDDPEALTATANAAGYDLSSVAAALDMLAKQPR